MLHETHTDATAAPAATNLEPLAAPEPTWIGTGRDGPPMAFINGMVMAPAFWTRFAPEMAFSARSAAYPLPGHHPWALPPGKRDLHTKEIVDAYAKALRRDFAGEKVTLVGHSTGGFIALMIARDHPDLVERIVLIGAFGCGRFEGREVFLMRLVRFPLIGRPAFARLYAYWLSSTANFRRGTLACVVRDTGDWQTPEALQVEEAVRGALLNSNAYDIVALIDWLSVTRIMDDLSRIAQPVLVMVGAHDPVVPAGHQLRMAGRLANASTVIFGGVGHLPMCETPKDFNTVFERFVTPLAPVPAVAAVPRERPFKALLARLLAPGLRKGRSRRAGGPA